MLSEEEIKTIKKLEMLKQFGFINYQGKFIKLFNGVVEFNEHEVESFDDVVVLKEQIRRQLLNSLRLD